MRTDAPVVSRQGATLRSEAYKALTVLRGRLPAQRFSACRQILNQESKGENSLIDPS